MHHARQLYGAVIKCIAFTRGHCGMHLGREIVVFGRQKFAELGDWLFPGPFLRLLLCHHSVLRTRSRGEDFYIRTLSQSMKCFESFPLCKITNLQVHCRREKMV